MRHAATLFVKAAPDMIAKGQGARGRLLGVAAGDVAFADGRFSVPRQRPQLRFPRTAGEAASASADWLQAPIAVTAEHEMHDPVFPNGCAVCEVEVDPETGWVELSRYSWSTMSGAASTR